MKGMPNAKTCSSYLIAVPLKLVLSSELAKESLHSQVPANYACAAVTRTIPPSPLHQGIVAGLAQLVSHLALDDPGGRGHVLQADEAFWQGKGGTGLRNLCTIISAFTAHFNSMTSSFTSIISSVFICCNINFISIFCSSLFRFTTSGSVSLSSFDPSQVGRLAKNQKQQPPHPIEQHASLNQPCSNWQQILCNWTRTESSLMLVTDFNWAGIQVARELEERASMHITLHLQRIELGD